MNNFLSASFESLQVSKSFKQKNKLPANPAACYQKEWKGWPDFLGKKK